MLKTIGKEYTDEMQRIAFLKDNCDAVENKGYMKRFGVEQMQEKKEQLSELSIEINDIEIEMKATIRDFKESLKVPKEQKKTLLSELKQKAEYKSEVCYKFIDNEDKMVGYYNSEGDLIDARPISPEEMQGTIFQINRTGTNN